MLIEWDFYIIALIKIRIYVLLNSSLEIVTILNNYRPNTDFTSTLTDDCNLASI